MEIKHLSGNLIKKRNNLAAFQVRYSGFFLNWMREEVRNNNQTTRKLMMIHKTLHPRDDVDILQRNVKEDSQALRIE